MGTTFSQYDPFSAYGQYNLKTYIYNNKGKVISVALIAVMIITLTIVSLWTTPIQTPGKYHQQFNIPSPVYGMGPLGEGLYLPPKDILLGSIS